MMAGSAMPENTDNTPIGRLISSSGAVGGSRFRGSGSRQSGNDHPFGRGVRGSRGDPHGRHGQSIQFKEHSCIGGINLSVASRPGKNTGDSASFGHQGLAPARNLIS